MSVVYVYPKCPAGNSEGHWLSALHRLASVCSKPSILTLELTFFLLSLFFFPFTSCVSTSCVFDVGRRGRWLFDTAQGGFPPGPFPRDGAGLPASYVMSWCTSGRRMPRSSSR
jgi:hypothetical protein